jgi:hypothetical protein
MGADAIQGPFATAIPIKAGDLIGFRAVHGSLSPGIPAQGSTSAADTYSVFNNDLTAGGAGAQTGTPLANQQLLVQATITYTPDTTLPIGCPPSCPPPPPGAKPSVTGFSMSATTFRAAGSGPTVLPARRKPRPPVGTKISYTLSAAATTTFTVERKTTGRMVRSKCVARNRGNRRKPPCPRYVTVGSFTHSGKAGANKLRFTGRLRGSKLPPGSYRLTGVASNANGKSTAVTKTFTIVT